MTWYDNMLYIYMYIYICSRHSPALAVQGVMWAEALAFMLRVKKWGCWQRRKGGEAEGSPPVSGCWAVSLHQLEMGTWCHQVPQSIPVPWLPLGSGAQGLPLTRWRPAVMLRTPTCPNTSPRAPEGRFLLQLSRCQLPKCHPGEHSPPDAPAQTQGCRLVAQGDHQHCGPTSTPWGPHRAPKSKWGP